MTGSRYYWQHLHEVGERKTGKSVCCSSLEPEVMVLGWSVFLGDQAEECSFVSRSGGTLFHITSALLVESSFWSSFIIISVFLFPAALGLGYLSAVCLGVQASLQLWLPALVVLQHVGS